MRIATEGGWVLTQAVAALSTAELPVPTRRYVTMRDMNQVPWDNCCGDDEEGAEEIGGQLVVTVNRVVAYTTFPTPARLPTDCIAGFAVPVTVELVRCAPAFTSDGGIPDAATMDAEGFEMLDEGEILLCHFTNVLQGRGAHSGVVGPVVGTVAQGCRSVSLTMTLDLT